MTLIARRSAEFAGVRFLKRGVNEAGYVGNDVETEQIVADLVATGTAASAPPLASFVQNRGSIPLYWSQENHMFEPKPAINICRVDPFYAATARHFAGLMQRYGAPVVVLNLIKQQEKQPRESKLSAEFDAAMEYLNSTLPPHAHLHYISWDWKAAAKRDIKAMIAQMCRLAERSLDLTGFFLSVPPKYRNEFVALQRADVPTRIEAALADAAGKRAMPELPRALVANADALPPTLFAVRKPDEPPAFVQRGVLRTNCIDSLDRTNAAHFIVGRVALGRQLYALGLVADPLLAFTDAAVELLMEMYEIVGNQVALQYAGSEAVHAMKSYDRGGGLAAQSRDLLTTIKRYYSNSFTDSEKQQAMNLFLGRFVPTSGARDIWELEHDWQLHNRVPFVEHELVCLTPWWQQPLAAYDAALGALVSAPAPPASYAAALGTALGAPGVTSASAATATTANAEGETEPRDVQRVRLRRRRRALLRVPDAVWNEWYAVSSLTSFDAMLARSYNAPTRHDAELSVDGNALDAARAPRRDVKEAPAASGALSTQLSGIKKFIPFGKRRNAGARRVRGRVRAGRDAHDVPLLWRVLLGAVSPPPLYHFGLHRFVVSLSERADALFVYRAALVTAGVVDGAGADAHIEAALRDRSHAARAFYEEYLALTSVHWHSASSGTSALTVNTPAVAVLASASGAAAAAAASGLTAGSASKSSVTRGGGKLSVSGAWMRAPRVTGVMTPPAFKTPSTVPVVTPTSVVTLPAAPVRTASIERPRYAEYLRAFGSGDDLTRVPQRSVVSDVSFETMRRQMPAGARQLDRRDLALFAAAAAMGSG